MIEQNHQIGPSGLMDNLAQCSRKTGIIAPRTAVFAGSRFSAQLIEEFDTETDVPGLDDGVLIQVLSHRPTVWTDLLGTKRCHDTPAGSFVYVPRDCPSWWHVRNCGGVMLHIVLDAERTRDLAVTEDIPIAVQQPPPSLGWSDKTLSGLTSLLRAEMITVQRSSLLMDTLALAIEIQLARRAADSKAMPAAKGGLAGWQLRRAIDHLNSHLGEDVRLGEVAAVTGLSPFHFCRAFKQSTGLPPHAWLTARRIERAQELMAAHPHMGLTEIALGVGYQSQGAFGVVFKRVVGVAPGQWRRERA